MKKRFLRIFSLLIAFVFIIVALPVNTFAAENTYPITQLSGKYKTQGRTTVKDGMLLLDWSASGIEFTARCSGEVKVTLNGIRMLSGDTGGIYFTVIVDGVKQYEDLRAPEDRNAENWKSNSLNYPFHITQKGEITFTIAKDLDYKEHTFEIYKQGEAIYDVMGIKSITLDGEILDAPKNNDLYIEVLGDSISAVASNLSSGDDGSGVLYQDATQGWPYMTARALNADWSVIARSGIMASETANNTSMQTAYTLQRFFTDDNTTPYNFEREPDIIIVCLGTNDMYHASAAEREKGIPDMLNLLREKNPNAKIVWIYGMMTQGANALISSTIENAGGWRKGYYGLLLEQCDLGHPKMEYQRLYTKEITKFLKNTVLNPEYNGKSGLESGNNIIYRATDSMDNDLYDGNTSDAAKTPYRSGEDTVWKFGVSGFGDAFKPSSKEFSAPVAEVLSDGSLKLEWTAPENASGKTTVKIIGETYAKEVFVKGNSVTFKDVPLTERLSVQVTVGEVSSKVLNYYEDPVLTYIDLVNSSGDKTTKINEKEYIFANLGDKANDITDNTGLLIKLESVITNDDVTITHYYDDTQKIFVERNGDSPIADFRAPISLNEIGYTFTWRMTPATAKNGGFAASSTAFANNTENRTRNFYAYDYALTDRAAKIKNTTQNSLALSSGLYQNSFKSGYILVPFESLSDEDISKIKASGAISLKADNFVYRGRVKRNPNGNRDVSYVTLGATSLDSSHTDTTNLKGFVDREMHYSQVAFVNDFDEFTAKYVNDTTGVISTPVSSVPSDVLGITYMTPTAKGDDYTLSDKAVNSYYTVDDTNLYESKIIYTTATGEKMNLGFKAENSGKYQVSLPVNADENKAIYYRITKTDKNGVMGILEDEKRYNGEEYMMLSSLWLNKGDTVWLEAWSDLSGTQINLYVPQFVYLGENATENTERYSANEYLAIDHLNDFGSRSVWNSGTFTYPFSINGEEYNYLYDDAYLSAVENNSDIVYDSQNILNLSATDNTETALDETDGTALLNRLKKYDGIAVYNEGASIDYFYQSSDGGVRNYNNTESSYTFGTPYRYFNADGMISVSKVPTDTTVKIKYGFGLAAGGGARNVYINFGHYSQFTAPQNGTALLSLGGLENNGKVIVLKGTKVVAVYTGGVLPSEKNALSINVEKGEKITVAYARTEEEEKGLSPFDETEAEIETVVNFTAEKQDTAKITFDSKTLQPMKETRNKGEKIVLPLSVKAGAVFTGWQANGKSYIAGSEFTVESDTQFKADFAYYGDLDGSGEKIDGADLILMRGILVGNKILADTVRGEITADINADGNINLTDLVRMKKIIADINVSIGVQ